MSKKEKLNGRPPRSDNTDAGGGIPKIMIFMTLAGSYTFLAMGICAAGVSQCC